MYIFLAKALKVSSLFANLKSRIVDYVTAGLQNPEDNGADQ